MQEKRVGLQIDALNRIIFFKASECFVMVSEVMMSPLRSEKRSYFQPLSLSGGDEDNDEGKCRVVFFFKCRSTAYRSLRC